MEPPLRRCEHGDAQGGAMNDMTHPRLADPAWNYWAKRLPRTAAFLAKQQQPIAEQEPGKPLPPPEQPRHDLEAPPIVITWEPRRIKVAEIIEECARFADVSVREMKSPRRARPLCRPRQAAMYIAYKHTGRSLPEIGRILGGRDHSTVLHGKRRVEADLTDGGEIFGDIIAHVERELGVA